MEMGHRPTVPAAQSLAFVVGTGIGLALSLVFAVSVLGRPEGLPAARSGERINPNEAPVASLMRLPYVGVARARAIAARRDQVGSRAPGQSAFKTPDDLQQIKGIGPAVVDEIRPWLTFHDPSDDGNEPSGR